MDESSASLRKALLKEDAFFDTVSVEARKEIDKLERLSRRLTIDDNGKIAQNDEMVDVLRRLKKLLKEAKEYSGEQGSDNCAEYTRLERAALEAMEEADDRKSACESRFAARKQLDQDGRTFEDEETRDPGHVSMGSVIRMDHDINERGEKHKVLNRMAREIHEIAQAIGGKIYEQDTSLDYIVKKNGESAQRVHSGQEEIGIARKRILAKKKKFYCLVCIAMTCLFLITYMLFL